jgi:O-methyltransferase involved in polyketide biosynthesis
MYSYLPWVINQSESEILNSHGKKYFWIAIGIIQYFQEGTINTFISKLQLV